jgi:hypothetical protein
VAASGFALLVALSISISLNFYFLARAKDLALMVDEAQGLSVGTTAPPMRIETSNG